MKKRVEKKRNAARVSPETLEKETLWLTQFVLTHIVEERDTKGLPIRYIFERYQRFLKENKLGETALSIDGFGRIFPKTFPRKTIAHSGKTLQAVVGIRFA